MDLDSLYYLVNVTPSHFTGRIEKEKKTKIAGYGFYNVHSTLDCDF
jgi:hypothetical protein